MKKALTLLAVAAMAAVSFVGCSKTYDVDASLETGTANYDLKGKTFVYTQSPSDTITKTVVDTTNSTVTTTQIAKSTKMTTIVFAEDGTYTKTIADTYTADIDGDYRTVSISGVTTTYTNVPNSNTKGTGLANMPVSTEVVSGKWISYDRQDNSTDGVTLEYEILPTSDVTTTNVYNESWSTISAATGITSTNLVTYSKATNNSTSSAAVANSNLQYRFEGQNAAGKDMVNIGGTVYVQQ